MTSIIITDIEKFAQAMRERYYDVQNDIQGFAEIIPSYYKTKEGNHVLIHGMRFCVWGGSNVDYGKLGCVTFLYYGKERKKYCKNIDNSEILKKAGCYDSAEQAIKEYDKWAENAQSIIKSWKKIM